MLNFIALITLFEFTWWEKVRTCRVYFINARVWPWWSHILLSSCVSFVSITALPLVSLFHKHTQQFLSLLVSFSITWTFLILMLSFYLCKALRSAYIHYIVCRAFVTSNWSPLLFLLFVRFMLLTFLLFTWCWGCAWIDLVTVCCCSTVCCY